MATETKTKKRIRDDITIEEITQELCEIETKFLEYLKLIYQRTGSAKFRAFKPTALWKDLFCDHPSMLELCDRADDLVERLWHLCDLHIESSSLEHCPRCKATLNDHNKCPNGHVWHEDFDDDRMVLCTDACPFCRFHQFLGYDTCRLNQGWRDCAYDTNHDCIRLNEDRYVEWGSKIPDWMSKMWT